MRTEGQRRVWCFRFYGRLTHCLWGLIFAPFALSRGWLTPATYRRLFLLCLLVRLSPRRGSSHVIRSRPAERIQTRYTRQYCPLSLWKEAVHTMRQQSGAALLSAGSPFSLPSPCNYFRSFPSFSFFFLLAFYSRKLVHIWNTFFNGADNRVYIL